MAWLPYLSVALGSAAGGALRYWLSIRIDNKNDYYFLAPTLIANLLAAYLIGLFIAFFISNPKIPNEWKLLLTTGFCGGLSTFSTFSIEMVGLFQTQRYTAALFGIATNLVGSFLLTALGIGTWYLIKKLTS